MILLLMGQIPTREATVCILLRLLLTLMVMVITSSVVVYGIMKGKSQQKGKSDTTQAETDPQPVDPFADMTYAYGSQKGKPRATSYGSGYDSS